jgi:hypothetical protein
MHLLKFDDFHKDWQTHERVSESVDPAEEDWYSENIEEPVRDIVELLRNNGFNTESSCGHNMEIQCSYFLDKEINRLHKLLYLYLNDKGLPITYDITISVNVIDGAIIGSTIHIQFRKKKLTLKEFKDIANSAGGFNPPDSNYDNWRELNKDLYASS